MNKVFLPFIFIFFILSSCSKKHEIINIESDQFSFGVDNKGNVRHLVDKENNVDYFSGDTIAPLLSYKEGEVMYYPVAASFKNDTLSLGFDDGGMAKIYVAKKNSYVSFELVKISNIPNVDLVVWGPFPTIIKKNIGETIGVVRGENFAIGIQSLNPKTIGGYPWKDNDTTPQLDIFEQSDYSDLSEEGKRYTLYRVEAAKPEKFGSTLQAYCRNRFKERVISNLDRPNYISPAFNDGGVIGSKIALFGCPVGQTLNIIGEIEKEEGLPHPMLGAKWAKQSKEASSAYIIYNFDEKTIDDAIDYTEKAGLKYLYHPGPFKNWGHFELDNTKFPHGWDGLKMCVDKAEKAGIHVGLHTLSNFITTNDPYVTPTPDSRLGIVGSSVLSEDINKGQEQIQIDSPVFFNQLKNNNLHTVMIGEELIRYKTVSESAPWFLQGCERGAWGTAKLNHAKGDIIEMLSDHAYKVFLTSPELTIEMAKRLAELFNYCGLRQISFDGLEGNHSTGMGNYGEILFVLTWWNNLSDEIKRNVIIDASRTTHYFWHIYTRMNWGEPWYAGFRESQTEYRLKNQAYFQRNLMPGMLGWFSMRQKTTIEDIEWMLARSAAFDAGYAFVTGKKQLETNGQSSEILQLVKIWEEARMAGIFTTDQKDKMKDINNEFHLERKGDNKWTFTQIYPFRFRHQDKVRQPGEPLFSSFNFENPVDNAVMEFIITAQHCALSNIKIEINNSSNFSFPVTLKSGETIHYKGGEKAEVLDVNLKSRREFDIPSSLFKLNKGEQSLTIDCKFQDKGEKPEAKMEVRIPGKPELLVATKN